MTHSLSTLPFSKHLYFLRGLRNFFLTIQLDLLDHAEFRSNKRSFRFRFNLRFDALITSFKFWFQDITLILLVFQVLLRCLRLILYSFCAKLQVQLHLLEGSLFFGGNFVKLIVYVNSLELEFALNALRLFSELSEMLVDALFRWVVSKVQPLFLVTSMLLKITDWAHAFSAIEAEIVIIEFVLLAESWFHFFCLYLTQLFQRSYSNEPSLSRKLFAYRTLIATNLV